MPLPAEPKFSLRGFSFIAATSSGTVFAGSAGLDTSTSCERATMMTPVRSFGSYWSLEYISGLNTKGVMPPKRIVWPSGAALATSAVPIWVFAPPRFSTTTVCPSVCDMCSAMMRPSWSVGPPAG